MAKGKIPDPLKRRVELAGGLDPAKALAMADAYLAEGRDLEAVAFLVQAGADERLQALREAAVTMGDAFLLREVAAAQRQPIDAATWQRLGEAATLAGKEAYAEEARRQAERQSD